MISEFDGNGNLPQGIHESTLEEFEKRFVYGLKRIHIYQGLKKLIDDLKKVGCKAIFIDGSYVTNKRLPSDFDACWDDRGLNYTEVIIALPALADVFPPRREQKRIYGGDILPAYLREGSSGNYFVDYFQEDENGNKKGIIKIKL